ncbi:TetR/AcrR family transcriptional regulator [Actinomadura fibrosa]|uniref:TetR/AcrR family transcriptional regulator n=1 Tax=Actinomadura fibrosa TaxID=111802 RepID=A0ABW2XW99_9ACTN|nr:TetR/AcrR family transcriptional regulator [Actinomadura fibrosa]
MAQARTRPLRADARDNRERIMAAARDAFVAQGPGAPLEEIARRAGTGIATLYRRFPDRRALIRAVVVDALHRTAEAAREALAAEPDDPFAAVVRYMHAALDIRTGAVIPALLEEIPFEDEELTAAREDGAAALQEMIDRAHRAGSLRPDVTFGDIGLLVVRLSRPLPGSFSPELNGRLGHRHLDLLVNGLRPAPHGAAGIEGPALGLDDLQAMSPARRPAPDDDGPGGTDEGAQGRP